MNQHTHAISKDAMAVIRERLRASTGSEQQFSTRALRWAQRFFRR